MTRTTRKQHIASLILASLALAIAVSSGLAGIALFGIFLASYAFAFLSLKIVAFRINRAEMMSTTSTSRRPGNILTRAGIQLKTSNVPLILGAHEATLKREQAETAVTAQIYREAYLSVKKCLKGNYDLANTVMEYYLDSGDDPFTTKPLVQELYKIQQANKQMQTTYLYIKEHLKKPGLAEIVMEYLDETENEEAVANPRMKAN